MEDKKRVQKKKVNIPKVKRPIMPSTNKSSNIDDLRRKDIESKKKLYNKINTENHTKVLSEEKERNIMREVDDLGKSKKTTPKIRRPRKNLFINDLKDGGKVEVENIESNNKENEYSVIKEVTNNTEKDTNKLPTNNTEKDTNKLPTNNTEKDTNKLPTNNMEKDTEDFIDLTESNFNIDDEFEDDINGGNSESELEIIDKSNSYESKEESEDDFVEDNDESELESEDEFIEDSEDSELESDDEFIEDSEDSELESEDEFIEDSEDSELESGDGFVEDNDESELESDDEFVEDNEDSELESEDEFIEDNEGSELESEDGFVEDNEDSELESENGFVEDSEDSESEVSEREELKTHRDRAKEIKDLMIEGNDLNKVTSSYLEDKDGNIIEPRTYGNFTYAIDVIPIDKITLAGSKDNKMRMGDLDITRLQSQIKLFGLINPLHVVPFGEPIKDVKTGKTTFRKYILLDGARRLEALMSLGHTTALVLVDNTLPKRLVNMYMAMSNTRKEFTFSEKVKQVRKIMDDFKDIPFETAESMVGFNSGEYLKGEYIISMKEEFPNYVKDVESGKLSIEQAFKKLEKDIEKADKDKNEVNDSSAEKDDKLEDDSDDLSEVQNTANTQGINDRKTLDRVLRRTIEIRDGGVCQCCGFGQEVETDSDGNEVEKKYADLNAVFNVHHMVAVQYGGSDSEENLILLCSNCHKLVHEYETSAWIPSKDTYNDLLWAKKVVVLGNILQKTRKASIDKLKKDNPTAYKQVEKKKRTIGQTLAKEGIFVDAEKKMFGGSPYRTFLKEKDAIENGREVGDLGKNSLDVIDIDEGKNEKDLPLEDSSELKISE